MVVVTTPKLADYVLNTTEEVYNRKVTSTVVGNYDLGPGLGVRRRMQNNGNGNKATTTTTTTTIKATVTRTTTKATVAGTTTTKATIAGTTTKATITGNTTNATVAGGPPPAPFPPPQPDAIELIVDPTDVKLFKMGVYMRMAHPQDGALAPIFSMPLCPSVPCTKTADQLSKGLFSFSWTSSTSPRTGTGMTSGY